MQVAVAVVAIIVRQIPRQVRQLKAVVQAVQPRRVLTAQRTRAAVAVAEDTTAVPATVATVAAAL